MAGERKVCPPSRLVPANKGSTQMSKAGSTVGPAPLVACSGGTSDVIEPRRGVAIIGHSCRVGTQIDDSRISQTHLRAVSDDGRWRIVGNIPRGMFVGGRRGSSVTVSDKTLIRFGDPPGLGRSGMQRQEAQFEATIRTVLHGNHKVAVLGKGGVGKTSVAACVGSILAELRQQDRIVGIDADTAFGRLSSRIDPRAAGSFWELTTDTNLRSFTDITARLGRNSAGLYVLAGQPASGPRRVLDPAIYREAALRLDHHFAISVIDCGSSMEAAVTQEVLRDVDALIVVSSPWADGASAAANTIEWLSDYGLTGLLRRSIVVLNDSDGHADKRTKSLLAQEFIDHGQPVVEVPFDPHLRPGGVIDMSHEMAPTTRLKILQVAATVTAYFASRPADAHGSPPR